MTHDKGPDNQEIHKFAWETFEKMTEAAREYGQYGAGQDLLTDAFSGNLRGMGPGFAEMEFEERASEPVICFLADKTEPGAWNYPLFKMFADPSTPSAWSSTLHARRLPLRVHDLVRRPRSSSTPRRRCTTCWSSSAPGRFVIKPRVPQG